MYLKCIHGNEGACYECLDPLPAKKLNECQHGVLLHGQYCLRCTSQQNVFPQENPFKILGGKVTISKMITIKKELWDEMLSYKHRLINLEETVDTLMKKVNLMKSLTQSKCSRCLKPISNLPYYMYDEPSYRFCSVQCMTDTRPAIKSVANCL